jgi:aryl-alcohol dehydrogenase-like predicted oxidoreductase
MVGYAWQIMAIHHATMQLRPLGSTGLSVTPLGLGLAALGRPEYITPERDADFGTARSVAALERRCYEMLDAAFAAGIRYVDAARSYGLAEQFLGAWLRSRHVTQPSITVGSKWGYTYTADWERHARVHEIKDLSVATLQRQLDESRAMLGNNLQLLQIHSATLESGVLDDVLVLQALARLRAAGLAIGLTVTGPRQADVIRRALGVSVDGMNPFQVVQATWNLLETSAGPALAEAKAQNWGVIVKEALANGRLTTRSARAEAEPIRRAAESLGVAMDAVAIAAAAAQPWADVVLSGAVTPAQLASNLVALEIGNRVDRLPAVAVPPGEYWRQRSALAWG